jgi:hypothetical protein
MMNKFYGIVAGMLMRARRKILNRWMMVRGLAFTTIHQALVSPRI